MFDRSDWLHLRDGKKTLYMCVRSRECFAIGWLSRKLAIQHRNASSCVLDPSFEVPLVPGSSRLPEVAPRGGARAISTTEGIRECSALQQPGGFRTQEGISPDELAASSPRHVPGLNWTDQVASGLPDAGDNDTINEPTALDWPEGRSEDWSPQHIFLISQLSASTFLRDQLLTIGSSAQKALLILSRVVGQRIWKPPCWRKTALRLFLKSI
jgi:hypothetical protein